MLLAPEDLPCVRIDGHDAPCLLIPRPILGHARLLRADVIAQGLELIPLHWRAGHLQEQHALRGDDLLSSPTALTGPDRLARRGVKRGQGGIERERDVDPVPNRNQATRQLRRPTLERIQVRMPLAHCPLPQDRAVECVPRNERPLRRQLHGSGRPFIEDVEDPPTRRHQSAHAGHAVVVPRPSRAPEPLHLPRRADDRVMGHRVPARVVQIVCPFINSRGARLHRLGPLAPFFDVRHPLGAEHSHDLRHRDATEVL